MNLSKNGIITGINTLGALAEKHLPTILMAFGTATFVKTVVSAVEHQENVKDAIHEAEYNQEGEKLSTAQTAKVVVKEQREAIGYGILSLACFYGAHGINSKRIVALASAYSMKDAMLDNYISATKKIVGENKAEKIQLEANENDLRKAIHSGIPIVNARYGQDLFFIPATGTLFRADMELVKQVFEQATQYMLDNDWVSFNYILDNLGLMGIKVGDYLGWDIEDIYKKSAFNAAKCRILKDSDIRTSLIDGHPCAVLNVCPMPMKDWRAWDAYDNQFNYED